MSPQRMDNNFEGSHRLPATLRGPHRRGREADAFPQMTDAGVVDRGPDERQRRREMDCWLEPVYDLTTIEDEWNELYPERHVPSPEALERLEALLTAARKAQRERWDADQERGRRLTECARSLVVLAEREEATA